MSDWRALARRSLRWWMAGLVIALPGPLRRAFGLGDRIVVVQQGDVLRFERRDRFDGTIRDRCELAVRDPRAVLGATPAWLRRRPALDCRIPAAHVLRRTVALPLAAEEDLHQALGFELERLTPFRSEQLCCAAGAPRRDPDEQLVYVDAVAVPRRMIDPMLARLRALGFVPRYLETPDGVRLPAPTVDAPHARAAPAGRLNGLLAILAALLALAVILVPIDRQSQRIEALSVRVAQDKAQALRIRALERELGQLNAALHATVAGADDDVTTLAVLEDIARRLPEHTWLLRFERAGPSVTIEGESAAAAALIEPLEASPLLGEVQFRTPVTQTGAARQRFQVGAIIEGVPAP